MDVYYRPIPMTDPARPRGALPLAGGWCWFDRAERMTREGGELVPLSEVPDDWLDRLSAPRAPIAGLDWRRPRTMGILNVTPDSFSDGGQFLQPAAALAQARKLVAEGAEILDIGGESTRPGAAEVPEAEELSRCLPLIKAIAPETEVPISIDTRKAGVARAALDAGAVLVNDVAAMSFDPEMAPLAAERDAPICLMHAQGDPATMQRDPRYGHVLLDVYDFLAGRLAAAEAAGINRARVILDPGIGFGKTASHNIALIRGLSLLHGLGCVLLLGASRKRFIGTIGGAAEAADRVPGSLAVALAGAGQGAQILRVHDIRETTQALRLNAALTNWE